MDRNWRAKVSCDATSKQHGAVMPSKLPYHLVTVELQKGSITSVVSAGISAHLQSNVHYSTVIHDT